MLTKMSKFVSLLLSAAVALSAIQFFTPVTTNAASGTEIRVVNPLTGDKWFNFTTYTMNLGDTFIVNITVADVTDLQLWQVKLSWDASLLDFVNIALPSDHVFSQVDPPRTMITPPPMVGPGYVTWSCTYINEPYWTFNGSGTLCQVELRVTQTPNYMAPEDIGCTLAITDMFYETFLIDGAGYDIPFTTVDGSYQYRWIEPPRPTLYIKQETPGKIGDIFGLEVWVKDVYEAWQIIGFQFSIMWDTNIIEPVPPYLEHGEFLEAFQNSPNYYVVYFADLNTDRRSPDPINKLPTGYKYSTFAILLGTGDWQFYPPFPHGEGKLITVYFRAISETTYPAEEWTWIEFIEWLYPGPGNIPQDTYAYTPYGHSLSVHTIPHHYRAPQKIILPIKVGDKDYTIAAESNTTITDASATRNTLRFSASGATGTTGYVNTTFPVGLNKTEITVFIDGDKLKPPPFPIITTNGTHYFIYFEFTLSTKTISIQFAPEFIPASIDLDPNTLNLRSEGEWITCYIELPEDYNVNDVNVSTIMLNDTIAAELTPVAIGDYDRDSIPDLMVKFDRAEVTSYILDNVDMAQLIDERFMIVLLTITGYLNDGTPFQGNDTIKIVLPMPAGRFLETL